jgi:hypothetical protein
MLHRPELTPDQASRTRVDDAVRALARLLARQAVTEIRMSQGDEDGPADERSESHGEE